MSRAVIVGGLYRWTFNPSDRAWHVIGRPGIRVKAIVLKAKGGRLMSAWVLDPSGETYPNYEDAMMAAEQQFGSRAGWAGRTRRAS